MIEARIAQKGLCFNCELVNGVNQFGVLGSGFGVKNGVI